MNVTLSDITLNLDTHKVEVKDKIVYLTPTEFDLLYIFFRNPTRVLSIDEILEKVWNSPLTSSDTRRVSMYISYLRKKLWRDLIITRVRIGYQINPKYTKHD